MEFKELMVVKCTRYKVPSTKYFLNERSISKEKDRETIKGNTVEIDYASPARRGGLCEIV
jgi:NAD kinase